MMQSTMPPGWDAASVARSLEKKSLKDMPYAQEAVNERQKWRDEVGVTPKSLKEENIAYIIDYEHRKHADTAKATLDSIRKEAATYEGPKQNAFIKGQAVNRRLTEAIEDHENAEGGDTAALGATIQILNRARESTKKAFEEGLDVDYNPLPASKVPLWHTIYP